MKQGAEGLALRLVAGNFSRLLLGVDPKSAGNSSDTRVEVQRELIEAWRYFDPAEYLEQVLRDAPLDRGRVWINEPVLLPHGA